MLDPKPPPVSERDAQGRAVSSELVRRLAALGDALRGQELPASASGESGELGVELTVLAETVRRLERKWPHTSSVPDTSYSPGETMFGGASAITGRTVGRFVLSHEIGRGGFGVVFKAHDPVLGRAVALKLPRGDLLTSDHAIERIGREAKIAATLDHPGIVPVYEAETAGAISYIASMYCDGPDLGQWLRDANHCLSPEQAAEIVALLAEAVHYAHQHGVIHRDIKPSNVLLVPLDAGNELDEAGERVGLPFRPRLTDFGLAQMASGEWSKTRTSVMIGTPLYMAPECFDRSSDPWGPTSDVYSLGAVLYELSTGGPPIDGDSFGELLDRIKLQEPTPPAATNRQVPADLSTICCQCLAKDVEDRYPSAGELAADLRRFLHGDPIRAKPTTWRDRLARWRRQPARMAGAGTYAYWFNLSMIAWMNGIFVICALLALVPPAQLYRSIVDIGIASATLHLPKMWLGRRLAHGAQWAFWPSVFSSLLLTGLLVQSALGAGALFEYNYPTALSKVTVHLALIAASAIELGGYLLALPAYRRLKSSGGRTTQPA